MQWSRYTSYLILLGLLLINSDTIAQPKQQSAPEIVSVHPRIGLSHSFYYAEFNNFQGSVDCGMFGSGTATGPAFSLALEKKFSDGFNLAIIFGYTGRSGDLLADSVSHFPAYDFLNTGSVKEVTTENKIHANLSYFDICPALYYDLTPQFINGPLRAVASLQFAFPISHSFEQKEYIKSPSNAVFKYNRKQQRDIASGDIASIAGMNMGLNLGLENMLKAGKDSWFSQYLQFTVNFNSICSDASWNYFALSYGIGYKFSFTNKEDLPKPPPPPPFIEPEAPEPEPEPEPDPVIPDPIVEITIDTVKAVVFTGTEFVATQPLVNAIFFNSNSSVISEDYKMTDKGMPNEYHSNPIILHQWILPRIASILKENPKATVLLSGATSGPDNEPEGFELGQSRADAVLDALVRLGINPNRIDTKAQIYPDNKSNQGFEGGIPENQRVDIIVRNAPLQEYVTMRSYSEMNGQIDISVKAENLDNNKKILIYNNMNDSLIKCALTSNYSIPFARRFDKETRYNVSVDAFYDKMQMSAYREINADNYYRNVVDLNLNNFEAILRFAYNSTELSPENKALLTQLIKTLPPGAKIVIYGSADATGRAKHNSYLAEQRASKTKAFIESVAKDEIIINTSTEVTKFPEELPVGRFLNRSIRIRVQQ